MFQLSFYPGLPDGLDLQAEVKSDVLQSIVVGSENCSVLLGQRQDLQVGGRECLEVPAFRRGASCFIFRLGGGAFHPRLKDVEQGLRPYVLELRLNRRDGDQFPLRPFAPDEYRGIRYDIHMQRLLKVIVLGLFPDQNAIII